MVEILDSGLFIKVERLFEITRLAKTPGLKAWY
jgi:hypothetical protein